MSDRGRVPTSAPEAPDAKRPFVRAAALQSAHDSGEMGRLRCDSMVDISSADLDELDEGEPGPDMLQ